MKRSSGPLRLPCRLADALALLDPQPRLLLELWLRGLDLAEIAVEAGLPEAAAEQALHEAIQRTRERLAE